MVSTGVQAPWRRSPRHRCQWGIGTVLLKLQKTMHLRTERTIVSNSCFNDPHWKLSKSLTCNLGSLGLAPQGAVASLQVGASVTSRETHGRKPFGFIKEDTICSTGCQEERLMCIDLRNFTEDYGEKYELSDNPLSKHSPLNLGCSLRTSSCRSAGRPVNSSSRKASFESWRSVSC